MKEGVKFCGVASVPDIRKASAVGGAAIGVIVRPDSTYHLRRRNTHSVNTAHAEHLRQEQQADPEFQKMRFVLVPRTEHLDEIRGIIDVIKPDRVQLAEARGDAAATLVESLSNEYGSDLQIAQVFHIDDKANPEDIDAFPDADIIHLDSPGPQPGGNSAPHDWNKSAEFVIRAHAQDKSAILAGGLNVDIVKQAIDTAQPDGVCVESANRRFGIYDQGMMKEFMDAAL